MTRSLLVALFVLPMVATACGGGSSPTDSPRDDVADALAEVRWPTDISSLERIFASLPEDLDGLSRTDAPYLSANYGRTKDAHVTIYAVDLGGAACPGLSGSSLVNATLSEKGKVTVSSESSAHVDGTDLAYVLGTRNGRLVGGWSIPDANWVFAVEASTPALRTAAIHAVIGAASS